MATTAAEIALRSKIGLDALHRWVDDLPDFAEDWDNLDETYRDSWCMEWAHLMADYLVELAEYARDDCLSPDQKERYRDLLGKLKVTLPLISKLKLKRPPVSLDVAA